MFRNLQYIIRQFKTAKIQVFVATCGLLLGWSCFISICLFLYHETSFDEFHQKYKQIYRINYNEQIAEIPGHRHMGTVGPTVGPAMKNDFPEVENFVRFRYSPDWIVRFQSFRFYENAVWYADSSVFSVFDFPLLKGNASTALSLPNNVVITKEMAKKYFGNEEAMGKILTMNNEEYKVTGVFSDIPTNSHLHFDFLLPFQSFKVPYGYPTNLQDWGWISFYNYVLLKPGAHVNALQEKLNLLAKHHFSSRATSRFRFELQPLNEIYFGDAKDENIPGGNIIYMLILSLSALMILLTAAFNFTNLFSAMSMIRAKEIGIRKMLGAARKSLAWNINRTAILIVLSTLVLSILILPLWSKSVPWTVSFAHIRLSAAFTGFLILIGTGIVIGLFAGLYPSLFLSGYDFQQLLQGSFKVSRKGVILRKSMLTGQFIISISLLCSVLIISGQMNYLKKMDIGFARDELMLIHIPGTEVAKNFDALRVRLSKNPVVTSVSLGGGRLNGSNGDVPIYTQKSFPIGEPMNIMSVSFDFFKTAGIPVILGKEFTREHDYDTLRGVILNESAARRLGFTPGSAIGMQITIGDILLHGEVMGVVKDFNYSSLHDPVTPLVLYYPKSHIEDIFLRFHGVDHTRIVASIARDWNAMMPSLPFDYQFMNDNLSGLYKSDEVFEKMFRFFSVMAILIACLGFIGLLSQDIIYRMKEIAIRKLLGAQIPGISVLLLKKYLWLLAMANLVAWPVSYYCMHQWLNEFPYRETIRWFLFPLSGFVFLILAVLSVVFLTRKAATANPVSSLRAK
jgi:putative ABC transport system permease protein